MKKLLKYSVFTGIILLIYFLLEPIFLHNIGKKSLPDLSSQEVIYKSNNTKANNILKKEYKRLKTPALSVAIGKNNKVIWANSIGYKDLKNKINIDSLTMFRIGSTSKAITSVGVGVLLQQGKLQLTSKVSDYVPYASKKLSELTLEQIASHTTGIRNYGLCLCFPIWEYYNNNAYTSVKESIEVFNDDQLLFEPATNFSYSSYNFTLLSAMIEGASKNNFLDYMKTAVFKPLNLKNTAAGGYKYNAHRVAKFYDLDQQSYKESYKVNTSNKWAGGGFLSTPIDLVKLGNALLTNSLIDSATTNILFKPVKLKNGDVNRQNYAIGWRNDISEKVFNDKRKTRVIHHGGVAMGSSALLILLPEYNTSVAITMNRTSESLDLFSTAYKFAELFITLDSRNINPLP